MLGKKSKIRKLPPPPPTISIRGVQTSPKRSQTLPNAPKRSRVLKISQVFQNSHKRSETLPNAPKHPNAPKVPKRSKTLPYAPNLSLTLRNSSKHSKTFTNGPKRSKILKVLLRGGGLWSLKTHKKIGEKTLFALKWQKTKC